MKPKYLSVLSLDRWVGLSRTTLPMLRVGFEGEWVGAEEVVHVELARYKSGCQLNHREEELALLLSDELSRVREILRSSALDHEGRSSSSAAWFFSAGIELLSDWHNTPSPNEDLYEILEKLRLDEEYRDLAYLTPVFPFRRISASHHLADLLRHRLEILRPVVLS